MQRIPGLQPTGPESKLQELLAPAHMVGPGGGQKRNRTFPIPAPTLAPKMIRQSDLRDHTMKVLGKQDPNFITMSKPSGPPGTDAITPNFGNMRNQPKGLLYFGDRRAKLKDGVHKGPYAPNPTDLPLKARPDSRFAFLDSALPA